MLRFLSLSLVALVICALSPPALGRCEDCVDQGTCVGSPYSGLGCEQFYDYCYTWDDPSCRSRLPASPLSEQFTIDSVEIVTPAGVTKIDSPRIAAKQPLVRTTGGVR